MKLEWSFALRKVRVTRTNLMIEGPSADVDVSQLPKVFKGLDIHHRQVEPVGDAYHKFQCIKLGLDYYDSDYDSEYDSEEEDSEDEESRQREEYLNDNPELKDDFDEDNYYELLELGHVGCDSTDAQIKKAYQKMLLKYHPDKQEDVTEDDPRFKAIQNAWNVLSNPKRRKGYDSTFEFDDAIPSGFETFTKERTYFDLYGPVFKRNSRFSQKKPVPQLGDMDTPMAQVQKFYSFWNRFESWREFTKGNEHSADDIEQAESREEKRWMTRKNQAQEAKRKKKEYERIRNLVERAQKNDPRIIEAKNRVIREKEEAKAKKIAEKKAKEDAERAAKEKEEKEKADATAAKKEKDAAERKARQNAKKALKKQMKKMDKLLECAYKLLEISLKEREDCDGDAHYLGEQSPHVSVIKKICEAFDGMEEGDSSDASVGAARKGLDTLRDVKKNYGTESANLDDNASSSQVDVDENTEASEPVKAEAPTPVKAEAPKPVKAEAPTPVKAEAPKPVKAEAPKPVKAEAPKPVKAEAPTPAKVEAPTPPQPKRSIAIEWSSHELSLLAKGVAKFPGGSRNRWDQIAAYLVANAEAGVKHERSKEECIAKARTITAGRPASGSFSKPADKKAPTKPAAPVEGGADWTSGQQKELEDALKKFPSSMEKNERWSAIAAAVEGKSKKECVERFKSLRASVLAKKQAA